jgi:hypothetical protein
LGDSERILTLLYYKANHNPTMAFPAYFIEGHLNRNFLRLPQGKRKTLFSHGLSTYEKE